MPLILNTPVVVKSEQKQNVPPAPPLAPEPRKAVSETLIVKNTEPPKKAPVRHSDFMMDMTISDNL